MSLRARQNRDLAHAVQLRALIVTSLRAQQFARTARASQDGPQRRLTFIRTLKENLLWVLHIETVEELRLALLVFPETYVST